MNSEPGPAVCMWAACERPATADGYCDEHRELTEVEAALVKHRLQAETELAAARAAYDAAGKVVRAEHRRTWRKADAKKRTRRQMAKQSRRKQR